MVDTAVQHTRDIELLAPAGGWEQLKYSLHFGADAVYLALDKFGLRQRAHNFSCDDLPRAVQLAHDAGARVFVTCNIFAHDDDLKDLPDYIKVITDAQADAVIVSDLGVLATVKSVAPDLAVHVSTQASVSNAAAARMWYELGARRIVCAREMSCEEIAQMRAAIPRDLELEVFVHGAMCMAVSGRCLISDFLADRPANKGQCVQPCRWEYALREPSREGQEFSVEQDDQYSYIFNSKDLNMLNHLEELRKAGVDSIKIEGRVKKAFYVATVVNAYRQVLDGADPTYWQAELQTVSHRPYSTGFFFGSAKQSVDDDTYQQLYDWVAEVRHVEQLSWDRWRVWVACRNRFYTGDELEILSPGSEIRYITVTELAEVYGFESCCTLRNESEQHVSTQNRKTDGVLYPSYAEVPCEIANKAMGIYSFICSCSAAPHDILRVKRKDPVRKN